MISVVTPVRDGEPYLAEAIESVLHQTLQAWEYVIVDGGSSDRSPAIAQAYAAREPRIRILSGPDSGMYDAVLKGLEHTTAPLCCWINADDRLLPWAFELVARYWLLAKADWMTGLAAAMNGDGLVHTVEGGRWYPRPLIRSGMFHGKALGFLQQEGTFFTRRLLERLDHEAIEEIRSARLAGDFLLWTRLARLAPVHMIPTVLGAFRLHGANMTRDPTAYYAELAARGFWIPPKAVALVMKAAFVPLAFAAHKRRLRQWRAIVPQLRR